LPFGFTAFFGLGGSFGSLFPPTMIYSYKLPSDVQVPVVTLLLAVISSKLAPPNPSLPWLLLRHNAVFCY
jgi:hypothetical protein